MVSFAIVGGILLNIGAYLTYKGLIFRAVIVYLVADLCWVLMAWEREEWIGMFFIVTGVVFGLLAFVKMRSGEMDKELGVRRAQDDL